MSYFGKFYLVGPEATKAVNWLFTADVSKAPGTGSAPYSGRILPLPSAALGNQISQQNKPGTQMGFSFKCCFGRGCGKRVTVISVPVLTGGCVLLSFTQELMSWGVMEVPPSGNVMGTGVNQAQPSPAAVHMGRSCPFFGDGVQLIAFPRMQFQLLSQIPRG